MRDATKLKSIIENSIDGIVTIDSNGKIESINLSTIHIFGFDADELIGQNLKMLIKLDDHLKLDDYINSYHQKGIEHIINKVVEVTGRKKDGTFFLFLLSVGEVTLDGKSSYFAVIHDITAQKIAEKKMEHYASELKRSNIELQEFAYISSHDLQEPLRKIQTFGDRIKNLEGGNLSNQGKDYLERMLNAASRMQILINDLLEFSKVTSKARPFEKINLNIVLQDVLNDLDVIILKSGASVEFSDLPIIEADPFQMRQLFQNLITNSIKFRKMDEQLNIRIYAKMVHLKKTLYGIPGNKIVELYFEDNGVGFDQKYKDKIFNVFQRLEGTKYEGSGIGLAICKKIATRHGGHITAKSSVGQGATFIITITTKQLLD